MALSLWLLALAVPSVAPADVFTVNVMTDGGNGVCEGIVAGDCSLRDAVTDAANGDTINVPAGNYVLSNLVGGVLLIDVSVTIVGAGARQTTISGNNTSRVIHVLPPTPSTPITVGVSGVTLTNGNGVGANNPNGGAVHVALGATLGLSDSAVTNSHSPQGGGIYTDGTLLALTRVTVSGNQANGAAAPGAGGGVYHFSNGDPARFLLISNSTISGNSTNGNGGGIFSGGPSLGLQSSTIAANTAVSGSGLFKQATGLSIQDSIIAAAGGAACAGPGLAQGVGSNNLATDGTCPVASVGDPVLGALTNNGGTTDTHALGPTSPAIGAASSDPERCTGIDQRGVARPQGGTCDIGAFEFAAAQQPQQPQPQPQPQQLPPPVAGKSVNLVPKRGTVRIKRPRASGFVRLTEGEQVPVGTIIDTLKGRVTLTAAANKQGGTATADFYDGVFKISQSKGRRPTTTLTLTEKLSCTKAASAAAKAKRKRRLWGDGSGRFRTKGKHSAATVVGTRWLVEDRCKLTLTRVVRGRVSVRDFVKKKTVIVRKGKRYTARADD